MLSTRHITTLCFFACIYFVLAINANRIGVLPYEQLNSCLERNTDSIRAETRRRCEIYKLFSEENYYMDIYKIYSPRISHVSRATDTLFTYLEQIKYLLNSGTEKQQKDILRNFNTDSIVLRLNEYRPSILSNLQIGLRHHFANACPQHWNDNLLTGKQNISQSLVILSVFQNDLALTEYAVVKELIQEGSPIICKFDNVYCITVPDKYFALPGEKITISSMLASYNKSIKPVVSTNKGHIIEIENGVATWRSRASCFGLNTISGTASLNIEGRIESRPFSFSYFVAAPGISLQLDNATTCYTGVQNPMTVSVPGFDAGKLSIKVKGATVTKTSDGHFNIFFSEVPHGDTYAFVEGTNTEGVTSTVASLPLNVKELPPPMAAIGDAHSGHISLSELRNASGLSLLRSDEFDMDYSIISYCISLLHNNNREYIEPVRGKGAYFANNPKVAKLISIAAPGDRVIVEDIVVKDRKGKQLRTNQIILKIH